MRDRTTARLVELGPRAEGRSLARIFFEDGARAGRARAITRAIAKHPKVLLCGEPTGALDFQTGKRLLEVLAAVNQEFGTTVAVITHNAGIAAITDRAIALRSGQIKDIIVNPVKKSPQELEW